MLWLFLARVAGSAALGTAAATTRDLMLPRMQGTATANLLIGTTLLSRALGPYIAERVSTLKGSLSIGMLSLLAASPIALVAGIAAHRFVPAAEATRAGGVGQTKWLAARRYHRPTSRRRARRSGKASRAGRTARVSGQ